MPHPPLSFDKTFIFIFGHYCCFLIDSFESEIAFRVSGITQVSKKMSCSNCFKGTAQEGAPRGDETKFNGRDTYVVEPAINPDSPSSSPQAIKGIVVMLSDAFGWKFTNLRILADEIARKGQFRVYLPDFFDGREGPLWLLDVMPKLELQGLWATLWKP